MRFASAVADAGFDVGAARAAAGAPTTRAPALSTARREASRVEVEFLARAMPQVSALAPATARPESRGMTEIDRRVWLAGAGAILLAGRAAQAAEPVGTYDYLFLDLEDGQGMSPPKAYAEAVKARLPQVQAAGGE